MLISIILLVVLLASFLFYVSKKPTEFKFARSGLIAATPEKIFPYMSRFDLCGKWSTYEARDKAMKKDYIGTDGTVGAKMNFAGKTGTGTIEFLKIIPNEQVELRLLMTKPFACDNLVKYSVKKEGEKSLFTWSMEGDNRFINKLMMTLIDCDKMLDKDMNEGFANLRKLVE